MRARGFVVSVVAALLLGVVAGCAGGGGGNPPIGEVFVVTTDYTSGSGAVINEKDDAVTPNVCSIHSDAIARYHDGKIFVVNRLGQDNIQVLDPLKGYATIAQYSVGAGTNPQDIAFAKGKAYISSMKSNEILIVDPLTGDQKGTVDLSMFADADHQCEPGKMASDGNRVYVSIMRLDATQQFMPPTDKSFIAVIDASTDKLVGDGILLKTVNPWPGVKIAGKNLYVGTSGNFGVSDGAVELIDLETLTDTGIVATEQDLGGDYTYFSVYEGVIYAIVSDASYNTNLVSYDTASKTSKTLVAGAGYVLLDFAINGKGELWFTDRTITKPGVRIWDIASGSELTKAPLDTGLPPIMPVFLE